jgi:uncharacterized membrane protein YdjX (TVP38/TMEM64 family)
MSAEDKREEAPVPAGPPEELEVEAADSAGASGRRLLILACVIIACIVLIHLTPLRQFVTGPDSAVQRWKEHLHGTGLRAFALFFSVSTVLIAIGVPRLFLCGIAGMVFGFVEGGILSQFSSLVGS